MTGKRNGGGQSRAFGSDGVFGDLNDDGFAFVEHVLYRFVCAVILASSENIMNVQKSRAFQANINKGRLHAGQYPHDLSFIDVAD